MDLADAMTRVLALAQAQVGEMSLEGTDAEEAIKIVQDFVVNHLGDD